MDDHKQLNSGNYMPPIGYGTWNLNEGSQARDAVTAALESGYRLIDTAKLYGNERSVGEAIRHSRFERQKIFLTTKLWNTDQGYHSARAAFEESLDKLGLDYIDLYLIHAPATDQWPISWQALEELYDSGVAKKIGVSNFGVNELAELVEVSNVLPAVNQIEFHPFVYKHQEPILEFCAAKNIIVQAYSPLNEGKDIDHPLITDLAKKT